jgi:hypothetical protein
VVSVGRLVQPIFRAMKAESDGLPKVGRSGRELGVRVGGPVRDIPVRSDGTVEPHSGGMSVALDEARYLPKHRLPMSLGGEGRDQVFFMGATELPPDLTVRPDPYPHALVEPGARCLLEEFESALATTRASWRMVS